MTDKSNTRSTTVPVVSSDKPNASKVNWRYHSTQYLYQDPRLSIRRDACTWPDGIDRPYTYVESGPAVIVAPFTPNGDVVLIRQFRYTVDQWVWEVPAGGTHDFDGTDYVPLVERELREEIGGSATEIIELGTAFLAVGMTNKLFYLYAAFGVTLDVPEPEPGEIIEIHPVHFEQALRRIHNGEICSMPSAYTLLRCDSLWRKRFATQTTKSNIDIETTQ